MRVLEYKRDETNTQTRVEGAHRNTVCPMLHEKNQGIVSFVSPYG